MSAAPWPPQEHTAQAYLTALDALATAPPTTLAQAAAEACARFPASIALATRRARIAENQARWPLAVSIWQSLHTPKNENLVVTQALAHALTQAGLPEQAAHLLDTALAQQPNKSWPVTHHLGRRLALDQVRLAMQRHDLITAGKHWRQLREALPDDQAIIAGWKHFQTRAAQNLIDAQAAADIANQPATATERLLRFEPLGGTCEFGLVQREFGAEPLSLLRWVTLRAADLNTALRTRLHGIGETEFTRLGISKTNEYHMVDSRYELSMHSFIGVNDEAPELVLAKMQRRMIYLRRKLLEDLILAEKTFLYRCPVDTDDNDIPPLFDAVRAYNPANKLLVVRMSAYASHPELPQQIAPGALIATIPDGRTEPYGRDWDINFNAWLAMARAMPPTP